MRIALDATPLTLTSGGLPRYVAELSTALAREFPRDAYILLSDQPFSLPPAAPPNLLRGDSPPTRRWWLSGVRTAIRTARADLFHGTNFEVPYLGATPAVLTIHDLSPWRDSAWHSGAARVRRRTPWLVRLKRARIILTVSEAMRREIVDYFGVSPDMVRAVPLAASGLFQPAEQPAAPKRPYFLFVGTLEPRKNIPALVDAWRATLPQTGADLVLVGRAREDFPPLPAREGLTILGEVPDPELPRLYSGALAFAYPTFYEGFGIPVLEAMQCGCPVVTSHDPAVREVSGGAALHVQPGAELAEALRSLASNQDLRDRMKAAGLTRAAAFSWARAARETRAVYVEAAA